MHCFANSPPLLSSFPICGAVTADRTEQSAEESPENNFQRRRRGRRKLPLPTSSSFLPRPDHFLHSEETVFFHPNEFLTFSLSLSFFPPFFPLFSFFFYCAGTSSTFLQFGCWTSGRRSERKEKEEKRWRENGLSRALTLLLLHSTV